MEDAARNLSRQELLQLFDKTMKNEILQTGTITDIEDTDYVWGIDFNHRWDNWFTNYHVIEDGDNVTVTLPEGLKNEPIALYFNKQ